MSENRTPSPVGIKDIARACGLSAMTVSRAMRNAYGVNPKTREKVLRAAKRMGYVPNQLASNLVQRKTRTVGIVIPDIEHNIFPSVVKGIESVLNPANYRILLCCSYEGAAKESQEVQALLERRVDGIILAPASMTGSRETVAWIKARGCELVLMDRLLPGVEDVDAVIVDDLEGARVAVEHLIERGYRDIAHIAGPKDIWTSAQRLKGYREALRTAGMKVAASRIVHAELTVAGGMAAMERLLERPERPDAVFCVNGPTALGAYKALMNHGIAIPRSIGLVGFSDILESEIMGVPLTTIHQNGSQIGRQAARILLERMQGQHEGAAPEKHIIKTHLIVRQSSLGKGEDKTF